MGRRRRVANGPSGTRPFVGAVCNLSGRVYSLNKRRGSRAPSPSFRRESSLNEVGTMKATTVSKAIFAAIAATALVCAPGSMFAQRGGGGHGGGGGSRGGGGGFRGGGVSGGGRVLRWRLLSLRRRRAIRVVARGPAVTPTAVRRAEAHIGRQREISLEDARPLPAAQRRPLATANGIPLVL